VALDAVSGVVAVGDIDVGGCDVATAGRWGTSWGATVGEQGCVWGLLDCRCSCVGGFVEYTTHSEERIRTTSCNGVSRAVDGLCVSFTASFMVSGGSVFIWVLDTALGAVFGVVIAQFVVDVGGDMAMAGDGSGCGLWDWGLGWGAVGRFGSVCRCL
jgi:hypothetical protein